MDVADDDGAEVAASLAAALARLTFRDLTTDEVTARVIESVVGWAQSRRWRVYRRAPSVLPLPAPLQRQHSVVDVACARPTGPPLVVEVDHTDRRRTVDKLLAEANAGRIAIWVRWGVGPMAAAEPPVHVVTCEVTRRAGPPGSGRLHSRAPTTDRPPPPHSTTTTTTGGGGAAVALPIPFGDTPTDAP